MAEPALTTNQNEDSKTHKKIKVRKLAPHESHAGSSNESSGSSFSSTSLDDREEIPLAARDSKWVGITFTDPSRTEIDENGEQEEILISNVDIEVEPPIYTLFPNLRNKLPPTVLNNEEKTTEEITRSLVGEKANMGVIKKSRRFSSKQQGSLPSLQELVVEEKDTTENEEQQTEAYITEDT